MTRLSREHFGGYGGRIILQAFAAFTDDSHKLFTIFDDLASVPCVPFSTTPCHSEAYETFDIESETPKGKV